MSVADHFDHIPDRALVRDYDSGSARRQFKFSVAIFGLFCVACAMVALLRFETPDTGLSTSSVGATPPYAGHL